MSVDEKILKMLRQLTATAGEVLERAGDASKEFGHSYVGPEHVLYAILADGRSRASRALTAAGITQEVVVPWLHAGPTPEALRRRPFTAELKAAVANAQTMNGGRPVTTGYLFLGLISSGQTIVPGLLAQQGVRAQAILALLTQPAQPA
jgi:ATP-dependent Clp protease ATP-binding subunit ClpC